MEIPALPKRVDVDQKRLELVEAGWAVIAEEGLEGATLRRVAARAGCTTGALTRYFPHRHDLVLEALRVAGDTAAKRMRAAARAPGTRAEALTRVLWEALPMDEVRHREWRVWLAFWSAAAADDALSGENNRRYRQWTAVVTRLVRALPTPPADPAGEAATLVALVDGLGLRVVLSGRGPTVLVAARAEAERALLTQLSRLSQ